MTLIQLCSICNATSDEPDVTSLSLYSLELAYSRMLFIQKLAYIAHGAGPLEDCVPVLTSRCMCPDCDIIALSTRINNV